MSTGEIFARADITIIDVCEAVRDKFAAAGLTTAFKMGLQYLEEHGSGNVVVFVPSASTATMGGQRMSARQGAELADTCVAYIWGASADDYGFGQHRTAQAIMVELIGALRLLYGGRVTLMDYDLDEQTHVVKYGEQYQLRFAFDAPITMVSEFEPQAGVTPQISQNIREP